MLLSQIYGFSYGKSYERMSLVVRTRCMQLPWSSVSTMRSVGYSIRCVKSIPSVFRQRQISAMYPGQTHIIIRLFIVDFHVIAKIEAETLKVKEHRLRNPDFTPRTLLLTYVKNACRSMLKSVIGIVLAHLLPKRERGVVHISERIFYHDVQPEYNESTQK